MMRLIDHLVIVPILLPLITGALLLLFDERRHVLKAVISTASTALLLLVAIALLTMADTPGHGAIAHVTTYLLGNWPAPFGIVLALDRLSALMLVLTALLGLASVVFSTARWDRMGPHYHTLFQFLLMGLAGAFLTGDLFNLFVFFEVTLASSYGLALHGMGPNRVRAGLHYIAVNLGASFLFLIGVSLIYGVTGTLNMADLAMRIPLVSNEQRPLLEAGGAILGIAFLVKAGMWPLSFWLPTTYAAASAPVAAIFAILSKVGVYVIMRLSPLFFGTGAGASAGLGDTVLLVGGIITIGFGAIGVLASQGLGRLAGYSVIVSSGTLLAAIGMAEVDVTAAALYYMASSTLAISAFFLLVELADRAQDPATSLLAVTMEAYGDEIEEETEEEEVGLTIPGTMAVLGICFALSGLLLAGLPPLSGFIAKFSLLSAVIDNPAGESGWAVWSIVALVILGGLFTMVSLLRAGIRIFWAPIEESVPRVLMKEFAPIAVLLTLCGCMTLFAGPLMRYAQETAEYLHAPTVYIEDVLTTPRAGEAP